MDPIDEFIGRYLREYDFYAEAARLASDAIKLDLDAAGVRAIVTHRAKEARRLEAKCRQRHLVTPYGSVADIYDDIVDLAGIRVALYFPGERDHVDNAVRKLFKLASDPKFFPEPGKARAGKRFTGYSAVHYRAHLREGSLTESTRRYAAARVEIQVASVLMHAWSEVEHDLAYKPLEGSLSEEEEAILDELNGLVLAGEIALERLQKAGKARSSISGRKFANHYDLAAYLLDRAAKHLDGPVTDSGLGRVDQLFELIRALELDTPEKVSPYLRALHGNVEVRPLAEQVVDELLTEDAARYALYRSIQSKYSGRDRVSGGDAARLELGRFVAAWILFEETMRDLLPGSSPISAPVSMLRKLALSGVINESQLREANSLRQFRNELVHGRDVPPPEVIASAADALTRLNKSIRSQSSGNGAGQGSNDD
ncbi:RelA/SpoT family protein [Micromonospora sp. M71_S20]|uniref:RelA/SpoT domain-containing protein n=1 Tax=Micromonospora sp. M71_S20 TaxID=592872 RepID=UPI000EAEF0E0|nr:RelA/SpoT domain-containing protein [Micromonospora sp. M71_S20]RLK23779.1 RelA/SpoT family protein [Micromonospora sp. M71_S20]